MRFFSKLYDAMLRWAAHRHAPFYLAGLSFLEASVFPIPPDVMLAPMSLSRPERAWRYAALTTIASILGGLLGYAIGMFFLNLFYPYIQHLGYVHAYQQAHQWFKAYGFWALVIAAFTPIPYKVFTIAAGAMGMALVPFILASLVGRGARFFLVSGMMVWGGKPMENLIRRYVDLIGWLVLVVIVIAYVVYKMWS